MLIKGLDGATPKEIKEIETELKNIGSLIQIYRKKSKVGVPETIILHGEDGNIAENIAEWEPAFESVLSRPRWNMLCY